MPGMATRVVLVPGFTQTPASWDGVRAHLPEHLDPVVLGVPAGLGFAETASALADDGGQGLYVGYSMGGRLALRLAVDHPDRVTGLVLVSASPGIADDDERAARRAADDRLADEVERDGVEAFLDRWLAQPMFATVPPDAPGLAARHEMEPATLAAHLRTLGTGMMEPLWDRLGDLRMPVLVVTGRLDTKFTRLGHVMVAHLTATASCAHVELDGGHALPLERPMELADAIARFADRVSGGAAR